MMMISDEVTTTIVRTGDLIDLIFAPHPIGLIHRRKILYEDWGLCWFIFIAELL